MKKTKKETPFPYAIRSYLGYLEGTAKSVNTIKNYRLDIESFQRFLMEAYQNPGIRVDQIQSKDLDRFQDNLREMGLKTNTRRRKILTLTSFLNYFSKRKKLAPGIARKIPAPAKIERIPKTFSTEALLEQIRQLPTDPQQPILLRNQVLLWLLAETGCLVSEVGSISWKDFQKKKRPEAGPNQVELGRKERRFVPISEELYLRVQALSQVMEGPLFTGFNRFGTLGGPVSSRGVELLVKDYGAQFGHPDLTPRAFRHSVVIHWHQKGLDQATIQAQLGLKTAYAFRAYELLFKPKNEQSF
jgi:site-specific recombinase XerD